MTFEIPFCKETSKTSQTCLQITFSAYSIKLKSVSFLAMSAAISLLHSSYMDECRHGKESTSVCAGEQLRRKKL